MRLALIIRLTIGKAYYENTFRVFHHSLAKGRRKNTAIHCNQNLSENHLGLFGSRSSYLSITTNGKKVIMFGKHRHLANFVKPVLS